MHPLLVGLFILVLCRPVVAGTVQQRVFNDRGFKLYVAIFKVTQAPHGSIMDVQSTPSVDIRWQHEHPNAPSRPVNITIPKTFVATAVEKIRAAHWPAPKQNGRPKTFYTAFYYSPQLGDRVIEDVDEPE